MSSGDTFLAQNPSDLLVVGLMFFWGASYEDVFKEDACLLSPAVTGTKNIPFLGAAAY